jgi:putative hemolysin
MIEITLILVLLVFNGVFAMAEIALVSAKKARLQQQADQGNSGAALALKLASNPEQFLSTVQVGITLVGVLAGAFGGASLAGYITPVLKQIPILAASADQIAFALVVALITYLSLIIGELVPKNLALRNPEAIACAMARPMHLLSRLALPLVWFLGLSTRLVMKIFGKAEAAAGPTRDGGLKPEESLLVEGVFDLREILAEEIMQPKPKVLFLPVSQSQEHYWPQVVGSRQTVFPVYENSRDEIIGMVSLRDLYANTASGKSQGLEKILQPPVFVAENQPALSLLATLKNSKLGAALVTDEFGTIRGFITLEDLLEEVVGELRSGNSGTPTLRKSGEGLWMADGAMEIDHVVEAFPELAAAVSAEAEPFQTLAGFIVHALDRLPSEGDTLTSGNFVFEIVDMDRQRIDKVMIRQIAAPENETGAVNSSD